jgi:hypothetical protein
MNLQGAVDRALWSDPGIAILRYVWEWQLTHGAHQNPIRLESLYQPLGADTVEKQRRVDLAVRALLADGLVDAAESRTQTDYGAFIREITPDGLRRLDQWPSDDTRIEIIVQTLYAIADAVEPSKPQEASALRRAAEEVTGFGREALLRIIEGAALRGMGLS